MVGTSGKGGEKMRIKMRMQKMNEIKRRKKVKEEEKCIYLVILITALSF